MPSRNRMMMFIDGENLVYRYQDMVRSGKTAKGPFLNHVQDVYVWQPNFCALNSGFNALRSYLYTSVIGDSDKVAGTADEIALREVNCDLHATSAYTRCLTPRVTKRASNMRKSKAVDISLVTDLLSHSLRGNLDVAYLLSGDGDFVPAVEEVKRAGVTVFISAFSSGLSLTLKRSADHFCLLDDRTF
jgi:uncharacterized LabA/DUF88 family protein